MRLSVAVCEPAYEVNVGHIARLIMNFGLDELILINPKVDLSKARVYTAHAAHVVDNARITNFDYLRVFDMVIGTTSIPARRRGNIVRDAIQPQELAEVVNSRDGSACILLGRESIGLTNEELEKCNIVVSIDTPTEYKALNISHSLAILLYEIYKDSSKVGRDTATKHEIELLKDYAVRLARLARVREHKIPMLNLAIERIMSRSLATSKEVMLLVTLFRSTINTIEHGSDEQ